MNTRILDALGHLYDDERRQWQSSPKRLNADIHQVILAPRQEHSRKPDETTERIERLVAGPYIELFARRQRDGWDVWGNQSDADCEAT